MGEATATAGARARPDFGLSPRQARSRRRLIAAAAVVFSTRSLPEVTVQDVLDEAGLSRGTFYAFFADKADLLAALYRDSIDLLHARRLDATSHATTAVDCVLRGFTVFSEFHATSARLIRVLASEALRPGSPLGPIRDDFVERTVEFYASRIEDLDGRSPDRHTIRALVLMSDSLHLHMLNTTSVTDEDIDRLGQTLRTVITRVLA